MQEVRLSLLANLNREQDRLVHFEKKIWLLIVVVGSGNALSFILATAAFFGTCIFKYRYGNFFTMRSRAHSWRQIGILQCAAIFSVNPHDIDNTKVTIGCMIWRLSPNHGDAKVHGISRAFTPLTEMFCASFANHVRCPTFVLITELHAKICMVKALDKGGDSIAIWCKCVFTTNVAKNIWLIFTHSPSHHSH